MQHAIYERGLIKRNYEIDCKIEYLTFFRIRIPIPAYWTANLSKWKNAIVTETTENWAWRALRGWTRACQEITLLQQSYSKVQNLDQDVDWRTKWAQKLAKHSLERSLSLKIEIIREIWSDIVSLT